MPPAKQGGPRPRRILFVCTANENRSPTAAAVFRDMLSQRGKAEGEDFEVRSAGLWAWRGVPMSQELVDWADEIYVMEDHHARELRQRYGRPRGRLIVLDIPDVYERNDAHLVLRLREQLQDYL